MGNKKKTQFAVRRLVLPRTCVVPEGRAPSCTVAPPLRASIQDLPKDFSEFASANKFECLSFAIDDGEKLPVSLALPNEAVPALQKSPRRKNKGRKGWRFLFRLPYTYC